MTVAGYMIDDADVTVRTVGRDQPARFEVDGRAVDPWHDERLAWPLRIGVLCTNATLPTDDGDLSDTQATGDPMERALLLVGRMAGMERPSLLEPYPEIEEYAFEPDLKMMATLHGDENGHLVAVKGAPESVLGQCNSVLCGAEPSQLDMSTRHA